MKKQNIDAHEVYKHYGMEKDLEAVKNKDDSFGYVFNRSYLADNAET